MARKTMIYAGRCHAVVFKKAFDMLECIEGVLHGRQLQETA